jgi:hypothetical protein
LPVEDASTIFSAGDLSLPSLASEAPIAEGQALLDSESPDADVSCEICGAAVMGDDVLCRECARLIDSTKTTQ